MTRPRTDGEFIDALLRTRRLLTREDISADLCSVYRTGGREGGCSLDVAGGPGMGALTPVGELRPSPAAVETFHLTRLRMMADAYADLPEAGAPVTRRSGPVDLLTWHGDTPPPGLFPSRRDPASGSGSGPSEGEDS